MKNLLIVAMAVGVLAGVAVSVQADGAVVWTPSEGHECQLVIAGGLYKGNWLSVRTPSGTVNVTCKMKLVAGNPVPQVFRFGVTCLAPDGISKPGFAVLSPAGEGIGVCQLK